MAKRSPILGYNHNVQYRGVVFHVQTEDSGVVNPHIFTHLFHAGVIVNTRKHVYDPDSDDGVVKALMQSQHKAILKELRRGIFDDKIDVYMADVPGLLPRGVGGDAEEAAPAEAVIAAPVAPIADEPTVPVALPPPAIEAAPEPVAASPSSASAKPGSGPQGRPSGMLPPPVPPPRPSGVQAIPPIPPRGGSGSFRPPGSSGPMAQAMSAPMVVSRATEAAAVPADAGRSEITGAFEAIAVPGSGVHSLDELAAAEADDSIEVYSPPLPSAAEPPGAAPERPGSYAQHRKRESASNAAQPRPLTAPPPSPSPSPRTTGAYRAVGAPPPSAVPAARPPEAGSARAAAVAAASAVPAAPIPAADSAGARPRGKTIQPVSRPRTPTAPRVSPPGQVGRGPAAGGGVVMSRPAVIVGTPRAQPTGSHAAVPPPPPGGPPQARVRKAREDVGRGLFGQDLISEKSLDEVILAYLAEDGADGEPG